MSILSCRDLGFSYDGKEALSGINLDIDKGCYLCIIGENGAGKSTLLKGILGLKKPASGEIIFGDGRDMRPRLFGAQAGHAADGARCRRRGDRWREALAQSF